jgi:hypothetical protein
MVNKALALENRREVMKRKRKLVRQHQSGSSSRPRVAMCFSGTCVTSCSAVVSAKVVDSWTRILYPTVSSDSAPQQSPDSCYWESKCSKDPSYPRLEQADRRCYNCGEKGHYTNRCPNSRTHANQPAIATPAPTREANSFPVAAKQNYACGSVNHVAVEEA